MRPLLPAILSLLALAAPAFAQNSAPPDFTGTWVLNIAKSKTYENRPLEPQSLTITCAGTTIRFRYITSLSERIDEYLVDGKERPYSQVQGPHGDYTIKAAWKRSVLVIQVTGTIKVPGTPDEIIVTNTDRWTPSADGRTLTKVRKTPRFNEVFVYDKQ